MQKFKALFKLFLAFAVLYKGHQYFFPWLGDKPLVPFYISILKDFLWALVAGIGFYILYKGRKSGDINTYRYGDNFKSLSNLFIITHILLLGIAIAHIHHKNTIDIFQRDIKNVQYIVLPWLFPLLIRKDKDIFDYMNWLIYLGIMVSVFAFGIYFFMPEITWDGAVLATFQSHISYGFFIALLLLILMSRILIEKDISDLWIVIFCFLYGALLLSVSLSAMLTLFAGAVFLMLVIKPAAKSVLKISGCIMIASILFYSLGLYDSFYNKINKSYSSYKTSSTTYDMITSEEKNSSLKKSDNIYGLMTSIYYPVSDVMYQNKARYTSFTGRLTSLIVFTDYLREASFKDLLFGDFSLRNFMEYDNTYFYFIRNDGVLVTAMLLMLLCSGVSSSLRKYSLFLKAGNIKMAGLSIGIAAFLLTATVIQFNLSYFLIVYPLNFLTYFLLILIFFMNPSEGTSCQNEKG